MMKEYRVPAVLAERRPVPGEYGQFPGIRPAKRNGGRRPEWSGAGRIPGNWTYSPGIGRSEDKTAGTRAPQEHRQFTGIWPASSGGIPFSLIQIGRNPIMPLSIIQHQLAQVCNLVG